MTSLFWKKQSKQQHAAPNVPPTVREVTADVHEKRAANFGGDAHVLMTPYLTEKSSTLAGQGQYTFLVHPDAEKVQIARAFVQRYDVTPTRVHVIRTAGKHLRYGRQVGQRSARKKAIVSLPKGKTIPFGVKT